MARKARDRGRLYKEEYAELRDLQAYLEDECFEGEQTDRVGEMHVKLTKLSAAYGELLDEARLVQKVGDKLQKKLDKANEEITEKYIELSELNRALKDAKLSRRATTITLFLTVLLFILVEGLIEPPIDRWAQEEFGEHQMIFSMLLKLFVALLIRPMEKAVEKTMDKRAKARAEDEIKNRQRNEKDASPIKDQEIKLKELV